MQQGLEKEFYAITILYIYTSIIVFSPLHYNLFTSDYLTRLQFLESGSYDLFIFVIPALSAIPLI